MPVDLGATLPAELFGGLQLGVGLVLLLLAVAFAAGWVDAVVGGGGLIQLPTLLLVPGMSPVQALATNKLSSVFGTAAAVATYAARTRFDVRTALSAAAVAFAGAYLGAASVAALPERAITPIILVVLIGVGALTVLRPSLGLAARPRFAGQPVRHLLVALAIGLAIGFYDGLLGPGTGSFLVLSLVGVLGYDFVQGSAIAKVVNLATNLGSIAFFGPAGAVVWVLGLAMGAANALGGAVGARTAIARGSAFVRVVFLIVVAAMALRLGAEVVGDWFGG